MPQDLLPSVLNFRGFLLSDRSAPFRLALANIRIAFDLANTKRTAVNLGAFGETTKVVEQTLHRLLVPTINEWKGPALLIGRDAPKSLGAHAYLGRAANLFSLGGVLMAVGVSDPRVFVQDIARAAFGVDPFHVAVGDFFGNYPYDDNPPQIPGGLESFKDFVNIPCVAGIVHAGIAFGDAASQHPTPLAGATISGIDPDHGCSGSKVKILGTGFGWTSPDDTMVMFTTPGGGCVSAQLTDWSDTEITVIVPANVGQSCVGVMQYPPDITQTADSFASELLSCLGPAASGAAGQISGTGHALMDAGCPDCSNQATHFFGGPPVINFFYVNGTSNIDIMPGDNVTVAWQVDGANQVTIQSIGADVLPPIPGPLDPHAGSVVVSSLGLPDGTVGKWQLAAVNDCGTTTAAAQVVVNGRKALVLSGGGAKGAFQVGAVRCLQDIAGVSPVIIAGTSVGALNAAKLAEGGAALSQLETLWLGMQDDSDLYFVLGWFGTLDPVIQSIFRGSGSDLAFEAAGFGASFAANQILGGLASAMGVPGIVYTVFTSLYPVVTGIIDLVKYYTAIQQALAANAIYDITPTKQKINANIDPVKVVASGIELRITTVALESGHLEVIDQNGHMLNSGFQVPLLDAVLASASIPIAFPPVKMSGPFGTLNYVDGAVRENVPVQAAVEAGADRVYALLLNPTALPFVTGMPNPKLINIAGRTVDLVLDEAQRNDVDPFRGFGVPVTVIAPAFLVHDTLLVDPGLISINMDYGYMRAYDEVVATIADRATMRQLADDITAARILAWKDECFANGERMPWMIVTNQNVLVLVPDPVPLQNARDTKKIIRNKTYQRIALSANNSVPSNRASWWQSWERHPWQTINPTPWDQMISVYGTLAAEAAPPP